MKLLANVTAKRIAGIATFAVLSAFLLAPNFPPYANWLKSRQRENFRFEWTEKLEQCRSLADVSKLEKPSEGRILTRQFSDGSWVAMVWHSFHTPIDGSWDGSVLRGSDNKTVWSTRHFCGENMLRRSFVNPKIRSVQDFWKRGPLVADLLVTE